MHIKLHGVDIQLPSNLTLEERMKMCEDILNEYAENFVFTGLEELDTRAKVRLDILGTYLLQGIEDIRKDKTIMSRYKEKRRPYQERSISTFELSEHVLNNEFYSIDRF